MVGLTAWMAGTAIAVSVAWLGANVVVRNAGVGPGIPVINASVLPSAAASSPAPATFAPATSAPAVTPQAVVTPAASAGATSPRRALAPPTASAASPSPSASAPASLSANDVRAYALTGGNVTLEVTADTAQLVTAVPDAGYSVQTWSGTGWLRVDFSSGAQVSSLIASWYQHAPTVTVEN
ncbi:MAG TPA: hypothetical protein VFE59_18395 [Trebonia sp.]|nr:hypothetical protein [Trebonia sp.]